MNEVWRPIAGYPGYEVSDLGRVRRSAPAKTRKAGAILSTRGLRNGYPSVDLCRDGVRKSLHVHRLVAAAFLEPDASRPEVNHKNGLRTDSRACNLEWASRSENGLHAYRTGLADSRGSRNGQARLTESDVREIRELRELFSTFSYAVIGQRFGVSATTVRDIIVGRTWAHV